MRQLSRHPPATTVVGSVAERPLEDRFCADYLALREPASAGLIDRLIVLLVCEDLGHGPRLRELLAGDRVENIELRLQLERRLPATLYARLFDASLAGLRDQILAALARLAAAYNFGAPVDPRRPTIDLHTLGHAFERSLSGRARKRGGVHYTPAWMTARVVDDTLGPSFAQLRPSDAELEPATLAAYAARVEGLRVLDPACGCGAFLLAALRRIVDERRWIAARTPASFDEHAAILATLTTNLFGVDVDLAPVERTRLLLGAHAGLAEHALAALDRNIRVGDSLLDPARGGFDCVVGNPPYVKFQALDPGARAEIRNHYASAKSGNFDLYIPFIECGLEALRDSGRMGIIAPNPWIKQASGEPLRALIRAGRNLERWVDFGDAQLFRGATTYTSLQFYRKRPAAGIELHEHGGAEPVGRIAYEDLPETGPWVFVAPESLRLINRLQARHPALVELVAGICVGVQTSADKIFQFHEVAPGRYRNDHGTFSFEGFLRPLVSGADVERYAAPAPARRILFPYVRREHAVELASPDELRRRAPRVWRYLRAHAEALRARERGKFDDARWYRFGRSQNIDKQHLAKLLIPRLVRRLAATPDLGGDYVADNVDVCYVLPRDNPDIWYLLGMLNCAIANFMFRRLSKPFRGDYRSANKQYIAPIPIPAPSPAQARAVAELARRLWAATSERRDAEARALDEQLDALAAELYGLTPAERALVCRA